MTDTLENTEQDQAPLEMTELTSLKQRAKMMGISFSNNISVETLREKIRAKAEGEVSADEVTQDESVSLSSGGSSINVNASPKGKRAALRQYLIQENMKLVRCRITNMDPAKGDLKGEIHTVANEYLGTVAKYIPYGEKTDDGYHVPYILFQQLQNKKFLAVNTTRNEKTGNIDIATRWAKEFAIEVLPPLTPAELANLANAQLAAGVFNED